MKISYAIPVCNEWKEIEYLLEYLAKYKREQDEIVVQCDQGNTTPEVYGVLQELTERGSVTYKLISLHLKIILKIIVLGIIFFKLMLTNTLRNT